MLQEVAHHFENVSQQVKTVIGEGFASSQKRPITRYARFNSKEYFAESLVAYFVEPEAFGAYDPHGSMMMRKALAALEKTG
jgi:hypothetical protein